MIPIPQLTTSKRGTSGIYKYETRDTIDTFAGYNHNLRINDNYMYDMANLTCDLYPLLSQRKNRGTLASDYLANGGVYAAERLYYINDNVLYCEGQATPCELKEDYADSERQIVTIGAKMVIIPDYIVYNIESQETTDINNKTVNNSVSVSLCLNDGTALTYTASASAPSSPADGQYWVDTSVTPNVLKKYSSSNTTWNSIATTYVKITGTDIAKGFKADDEGKDAVSFSGFATYKSLNTETDAYKIIYSKASDDSWLITTGIINANGDEVSEVTIERKAPGMDYITSMNNRIWGCSSSKHEVYSCKLGDPTNWRVYQGIASDSYAATVGSLGDFTGAGTFGSYVLFFKDDCIHKLYGTKPSNFTFSEIACNGVMPGSSKSICTVNDYIYYLSRAGIMRFEGSLPAIISETLGNKQFKNGVAGTIDNKYYISMYDTEDEEYAIYVYDTSKKVWTKEDNTKIKSFANVDGELYFTKDNELDDTIHTINGTTQGWDNAIIGHGEEALYWNAETGAYGLSTADQKWVSKIVLRADISRPDTFRLYVSYDDGDWELQEALEIDSGLNSYHIPIVPRRCDHFKIKIAGEGEFKLYSISKIMWQGSELNV